MNRAEYLARRAALRPAPARATCAQCRKAVLTCYCHVLRPFTSPVEFVILQHAQEARNAIATARMAHLSITNSKLLVGRSFDGDQAVERLLADPARRNFMLYPAGDALPLENVLACEPAPVFWVLDAKWSQVPKMLRLSPNLRQMPMVRFSPERQSTFQIRKQPSSECLSTIESIYLVIERHLRWSGQESTDHHALLDAFRYLVQQQLDFADTDLPSRHQIAKAARRARRRRPTDPR